MCRVLEESATSKALRQTFGKFATGVAVVTARDHQRRLIGMTINSFCSISLNPALVSWCVNRAALSYMDFANCTDFTITVLAANQREIADRFARRGGNKFEGITDDGVGSPAIADGCAVFYCDSYNRILRGDHMMLIGKVNHFEQYNREPLIFTQGELVEYVRTNESFRRASGLCAG